MGHRSHPPEVLFLARLDDHLQRPDAPAATRWYDDCTCHPTTNATGWKCKMNRLIQRGLLTDSAEAPRPDPRLPLRMQAMSAGRSPLRKLRLSERSRGPVLAGLAGGAAALGCLPYLSGATPVVAAIVQSVVVATVVALTHRRLTQPRPVAAKVRISPTMAMKRSASRN